MVFWSLPWRRQRLSTPVFWPGEFHGLYSPWGHKELDTTEQLSLSCSYPCAYIDGHLCSRSKSWKVPKPRGFRFSYA